MLTMRVGGAARRRSSRSAFDAPGAASCSSCSRRRARRTCRRPPAARASPATALPPLRLRSRPQPQRITAGDGVGVQLDEAARARRRRCRRRAAARSIVHGAARGAQLVDAGRVIARGTSRSAQPAARTARGCSASATGRSVPGPERRCADRRAARAACGADRSTTSFAPAAAPRSMYRDEVDAGRRRVDAPQHDQPRGS